MKNTVNRQEKCSYNIVFADTRVVQGVQRFFNITCRFRLI